MVASRRRTVRRLRDLFADVFPILSQFLEARFENALDDVGRDAAQNSRAIGLFIGFEQPNTTVRGTMTPLPAGTTDYRYTPRALEVQDAIAPTRVMLLPGPCALRVGRGGLCTVE